MRYEVDNEIVFTTTDGPAGYEAYESVKQFCHALNAEEAIQIVLRRLENRGLTVVKQTAVAVGTMPIRKV